jgi:hypothetical protein
LKKNIARGLQASGGKERDGGGGWRNCAGEETKMKREDDESWLLPPPSSMKLEAKGHPLTVGPPFSHRQTHFRRFEEVTLPLPPPAAGLARKKVVCGEESKERRGPREPLRAPGVGSGNSETSKSR